jgi:hypothetical protein
MKISKETKSTIIGMVTVVASVLVANYVWEMPKGLKSKLIKPVPQPVTES